jgi:Tfp pilus assembly protein PilX
MNKSQPGTARQHGVALIVVMLLLVVATVVAISGVRFGSQELLIAASNEQRLSAYQVAQSAIDATISNTSYTTGNNPGVVACTSTAPWDPDKSAAKDCSTSLVSITSMPSSYLNADLTASPQRLRVAVERLGATGQCQRGISGTSMVNFSCAQYAVLAEYIPGTGGARTLVQQGRTVPQINP